MDTQENKPKIMEDLEKAGITNLRTLVMINWKGKEYRFVPRITITIDLEKKKKGIHMSRLIESIIETVEEETGERHSSIEELEKHILEHLKGKHTYKRGEIWMETELVVPRKTPVTRKQTMETHDVRIGVFNTNNDGDNGKYGKILEVKVIGNTVCPHAIDNWGKTHIQRALGILEIRTDYDNEVELEDMIRCVEDSFSSEVYTLLKSEDEHWVVDRMFQNPKFVEDVTREILHHAKQRFKDCEIKARTISQESIHRHDVVAEGSGKV